MKKHKLAWLLAGALLLTACKGAEPAPGTSASSAEPAYSAPESSIPAGPEENQPEQALKKGPYWVEPEGRKEPEAAGEGLYCLGTLVDFWGGPYGTFWIKAVGEDEEYRCNAYFSNTGKMVKSKDYSDLGVNPFFEFTVFSYLDEDRVICINPLHIAAGIEDTYDSSIFLVKSDGTMQRTQMLYQFFQQLKKEDGTFEPEPSEWGLYGVVFDRESDLHYALIANTPSDDSQFIWYFAIFDKEFNFLEYQPVDGALQEFGAEAFYLDWQDAYEEAKLSINYIGSHKVLVTRQFFTGNSPITYAIYNLETKELVMVKPFAEEIYRYTSRLSSTPWGYVYIFASVYPTKEAWDSMIKMVEVNSGEINVITPFPKEEGGKLETPFGEITVKKITRCPTAPDQSFMLFVECEEYAWQPPEANKRIWPEGTYTQAIVKYNMDGTKEFVAPASKQALLRGVDQAGRLLIYWDGENNG